MANIYREEETLSYQYLTNSAISSTIDLTQDSCCFDNQDSISSQHLELDQYQSFDKLTSFPFNEIELECECDPDPQPCDSFFIFKSMLIPVSSLNLDQFSEPTFIPVTIDLEIESQNLDSHIPMMGDESEF